jgi:predicted Zn-dependent protease
MLAYAPTAQALSLIRDAEIERTLRTISAPVLQAAGLAPSSVEFYIINNRNLNAFVAGGRRIFLNTGLMIELETPEELLGVIAHEAGHIVGGHEARRAINLRNAQGPALVGLLVGIAAGVAAGNPDVGTALATGSQGALTRSFLRNNRAEEASADQAGLSYLTRAGVNPEGLLKVMERFRGQEVLQIGSVDPYILTHPLGTQRMALIQRRVEETAGRTWPEDPERDYWHARLRAKLSGFLQSPERVLNRLAELPETELTLYEKAIALHRVPDLKGALAAVDQLIAMRPSDPFYIELRGQILLESGQAADAVPAYRKATQLAPETPLLLAGLGRSLLQLNTAAANAEALEVLKQARSRDLADAASLRDLSIAYERSGDTGMATLAQAELNALRGNVKLAARFARQASGLLPEGSAGWLRAQDILKLDVDDD